MIRLLGFLGVVAALMAAPVGAASLSEPLMERFGKADVVILGEVHDNPAHHETQQAIVRRLEPRAVVWEMLTEVNAARITQTLMNDPDQMARVLAWAESGWPEFSLYYPIFKAAGQARIYGGNVPRQAALSAMEAGPAVAFGADAARYGLTIRLDPQEQAEREAMQQAAHCNALPPSQLGQMVSIQRLRDAVLARAVINAMDETGGPIVVITGNGHARRDWGIPVYLQRVRPGLRVMSVGQSEEGRIEGVFDAVLDGPGMVRSDPCAAFQPKG